MIPMLQQYKNILVPVDGSKEAELAFKKAVQVAKRNGPETKLHLIHVVDTRAFQNISSFDTAMVEQITDTARKTIEGYVAEAKEAGLENTDYSIEYGAPKVIIAKEVPEEENVDLIMIGATGLNAVERLLIGSVTEYVTRTAACDVLVVRTDLENNPVLGKDKDRKKK
ncbi:universal stress protein UspA [Liquorilactobacillus aquaticus DSM 21051]|uniref:Universal stress protein UspA n=2 Tax=Liquorilactobacillus aquaticus TaxID=392566 RepID=A0A0R2D0Q7_9LACO|nr:universal stress protein UspA [Liquorilactobacillus aquaticus DSM 21051]